MISTLLFAALLSNAPSTWQKVGEEDAFTTEKRILEDSSIWEIRLTTQVPLKPEQIAQTIWDQAKLPEYSRYVKKADVLSVSDQEQLVYLQIRMPLLSDRDYTLKLKKQIDEATKTIRIVFNIANDLGPGENRKFVRMQRLKGSWLLETTEKGTTRLRYTVDSDPNVALPSFLINSQLIDAQVAFVRAVVQRTIAQK